MLAVLAFLGTPTQPSWCEDGLNLDQLFNSGEALKQAKTMEVLAYDSPIPDHEAAYHATVVLTSEQTMMVAERKATCPFIGTAVALKSLLVRNTADKPLASINEVVQLGDSGGGDLGSRVLKVFAQGNHAFLPAAAGATDQPVPAGLFSLDFPASQGSHPGHSGILQGDPTRLDTGRFSQPDFERLTSRARNGHIKRSDVGKFIAENLIRDPQSKVFGARTAKLLASDIHSFVGTLGPYLLDKLRDDSHSAEVARRERELLVTLTRTAGEDNLVGSSGEFGLLFAFFANKPGAQEIDGEPALAVNDLTAMFRDKTFPAGWELWPKTGRSWIANTLGLTVSAGKEYLRLKKASN